MSEYPRVVDPAVVKLFKVEARRWIDTIIGEHRDDDRTDTEAEALAKMMASHFVGGFNAGVDTCLSVLHSTPNGSVE